MIILGKKRMNDGVSRNQGQGGWVIYVYFYNVRFVGRMSFGEIICIFFFYSCCKKYIQ